MSPEADLITQETTPPPLDGIPHLVPTPDEIHLLLALDHKDGFLLSLIDGRTSVGDLVDIAAMPQQKVLVILARWLAMGVIELDSAAETSRRRG